MSEMGWQNFRMKWVPGVDMALKLSAALWLVMSLISSFELNHYLSIIGQPGLPLDLSGIWAIFFMFGGISIISLACLSLPVLLARYQLHKDLPDGGKTMRRDIAFLWAAIAVSLPLADLPQVQILGWWVPPLAALLLGLSPTVIRWTGQPWPAAPGTVIGRFLLLLGGTAFLFFELTWVMMLFLGLQFDGNWVMWTAALMSCAAIWTCLFLPIPAAVGVILAGMIFVVLCVSPGPEVLMQIGLFNSNLGGGTPAQAITSRASAQICNLGTASRSVLYVSEQGCTKHAALLHLRKLLEIEDPLERATLLNAWRTEVEETAP